jgi:hypothetical protein
MDLLDNVAKTDRAKKFADSKAAGLLVQFVMTAAAIGAAVVRPKTLPVDSGDNSNER